MNEDKKPEIEKVDKIPENAILIPDMCAMHQGLLNSQAKYAKTDPWRALQIAAQVTLFQAATCNETLRAQHNADVKKIAGSGCLACKMPDRFGEIVEAAKSRDLKDIKDLGDKWVSEFTAKHINDRLNDPPAPRKPKDILSERERLNLAIEVLRAHEGDTSYIGEDGLDWVTDLLKAIT